MAISYTPLEGGFINSISGNVTDITSIGGTSFFASTSFIYTLAFVVIIVAASFRYAYAGTLRLPGSEEGIRKSKEEFRRVTYGLLGVLGLWLILATVNKDMLTGNVSLGALRLERVGTTTSASTVAVSNVQTVGSGK